jgi:hypothetical protein
VVTGERLVRSWRTKEILDIRKEVLFARRSFAEQMWSMTDHVSRVHSFCELAVLKLGDEVGDIKEDFQIVDSAVKKLGDEIGKIEKTDSSEIFKELAWREERRGVGS